MHAHAIGFLPLTAMWLVMMAGMMAPAAWPWVRAFDRLAAPYGHVRSRAADAGVFIGGYLAAWLIYSLAAAALQLFLANPPLSESATRPSPLAGAAVLGLAGAYQFAPLKRACLTHCRNPLGYFLRRWRDGAAGSFRMGFGHGLFCVGCCWALMATALAVGVMNLWWMAALAAAAFVEQVVPGGDRLRVPLGAALIVAGIMRAA
jgi:predicted metal-binding membrane protein